MFIRLIAMALVLASLLAPAIGDQKRMARERVLGLTWTGALVEIDPRDGSSRHVAYTGSQEINALAKDRHGRLIAIGRPSFGSPQVLEIDRADGQATMLRHAYLNDVTGLAFSPEDVLYAVDSRSVSSKLYTFDLAPGSDAQPTLIGNMTDATGQGIDVRAIAFSPDGRLYAWSGVRGLLEVAPTTGFCADIDLLDGGTSTIQSLAFDADGSLYGFREQVFRMNTIDGSYAAVSPTLGFDVRGAEFVRAIPAR